MDNLVQAVLDQEKEKKIIESIALFASSLKKEVDSSKIFACVKRAIRVFMNSKKDSMHCLI